MYARKDIRTVLPDAVLRCRKLQSAANIEIDEMEKAKFRRINNLDWQQQAFQRTLTERHKRWRVYDRAFRLKLKRELGADLAAALRLRTMLDEEQKFMFEQQLIEQSLANPKRNEIKKDEEQQQPESNPAIDNKNVTKSTSAHPKSDQTKVSTNKGSQSAVDSRRVHSAAIKSSRATSAVNGLPKLSTRRPRTSRFDTLARRDTDPSIGLKNDFGSVLLRILSNIAATPDLDDDFTIRKRALEARERRLILTKDDRYYNLIKELAPRKIPGEKETDDTDTDTEEDD